MKLHGHVPLNVRKVGYKAVPCEACGVRNVRYEVRLSMPGKKARVEHRLCDYCTPDQMSQRARV